MGIDTVKLKSPPLGERMVRRIERKCERWQQVHGETAEVLFEITRGTLQGSWDSRISIRPKREDYIPNKNGRPELHPCTPYITLECSVAKVFNGQNIYGNPTDFQATCHALIDRIATLLEVPLPDAARWIVRRVDWAESYSLPFNAIQEFFEGVHIVQFPRRKGNKYGDHGVHFAGKTTTLKIYHKGPEFAKHDHYRMKRFFKISRSLEVPSGGTENARWVRNKLAALQRLANNRLRVEVEIHADKFDADFGHKPRVDEVNDEYLTALHDREVRRLLREGKSGMDTVRLSRSVSKRLSDCYGDTVGNRLHGFWCQLSTHGEDICKSKYTKATFYRNRRQLTEAGVSWHCTDVKLIRSVGALPVDFAPIRTDPRLCSGWIREKPAFPMDRGLLKLVA